jgi:glycosyltransferase involved in cell wall biosynthesis
MVVSPSETGVSQYMRGSIHEINDHISLKTFDSFHSRNKLLRGVGHKLTKSQLLRYLRRYVTAEDTLIVYHSLVLMEIVRKIKQEKKCRLIIEVEELYSDVREDNVLRKKEIDYLQIADQYIMITELLNREVNLSGKPYLISHGTYRTVPKYCEKFDDGKIHVVYAGSFNPVKGGALTAIGAAEFLDEKYVLHVLGKGSEEATAAVRQKIEQVAVKTECRIVFEGYKTGREFDSFIQSCHIGLSTQQPDGKYNASSFPSKILMYMSNGLPVVSVKIPAVELSQVGEYICYYQEPAPEKIAQAIRQVPADGGMRVLDKLNALDKAFHRELSDMLGTAH